MESKRRKVSFAPGVLQAMKNDMSPEQFSHAMSILYVEPTDESVELDLTVLVERDPTIAAELQQKIDTATSNAPQVVH